MNQLNLTCQILKYVKANPDGVDRPALTALNFTQVVSDIFYGIDFFKRLDSICHRMSM